MKKEVIHEFFQSDAARFILMAVVFVLLLGIARNLLEFSTPFVDSRPGSVVRDAQLPAQSQLSELSRSDLFGSEALENASSANLGFVLEGILFSTALISAPGQAAQPYHVGDRLPNGGLIDKILPDAVIIDQNGQLIKLSLQRSSLQFAPPSSQSLFH